MMGTCTSTSRHHRQKDHQQLHKRITLKNSFTLDNKQISPLPIHLFSNQQTQHPKKPVSSTSDVQSSSLKDPIFHPINSNSLIQLYLPNTNNTNRSTRHSWMSSPSFTSHHAPTRIPIAKTRLSLHQTSSSQAETVLSKNGTKTVSTTKQQVVTKTMSTPIRTSAPSSTTNNGHHRTGCIPRPVAPGLQQIQTTTSVVTRSRSISPSSTASGKSASSTASQRLNNTYTIPKPTSNRPVTSPSVKTTPSSKSKVVSSSSQSNKTSASSKSTIKNRLQGNTSSQNPTSISKPTVQSTKTNINAVRDRYKTQSRINFYGRRIAIPNSMKPASIIKEEKHEQSSADEHVLHATNDNQTDDLKTESSLHATSSHGDSAYASVTLPTNRLSSAQYSKPNRQRRRAPSTLSSSSHLSDVLNNDGFLDDENCSLKSDDLICDYDDTLTLESASKNERTDSFSSTSLSMEATKKPTTVAKLAAVSSSLPPVLQDNRSTTKSKGTPIDKINANLRESLDELTELSNRMENIMDGEQNRKILTRSVSLKPPASLLPPREDGEQIIMDVESYRQIMKDVMVVKTIFHQLDRLLKHSDGTNMTDSMIGSFHESMIGSRHFSISSNDSNLRNPIDENSTYDDLVKEVILLRKEREQDKQTIKLLQDQMYKYSSQTNI